MRHPAACSLNTSARHRDFRTNPSGVSMSSGSKPRHSVHQLFTQTTSTAGRPAGEQGQGVPDTGAAVVTGMVEGTSSTQVLPGSRAMVEPLLATRLVVSPKAARCQ